MAYYGPKRLIFQGDDKIAILSVIARNDVTKQSIRAPAIYIMASKPYGTLYTGVTSNLVQRVFQHKEGLAKGFTSKHDCKILVYYELHETMESAIMREKQIKGGSRKRKLDLIKSVNADWNDLYPSIS